VITSIAEFTEELRAVGVPVSMVEAIDAAEALRHVDLADREAFKAALAATLVKNHRHLAAFDVAFDVYFGLAARPAPEDLREAAVERRPGEAAGAPGVGDGPGSGEPEEGLLASIIEALVGHDRDRLRALVERAVEQLAGMEPGRPVGGRYYFYRVMRRLGADQLAARLLEAAADGDDDGTGSLASRLAQRRAEARADEFRSELRREITRRLVADRGRRAVAKTLRVPLVEDIDLMHATRAEVAEIERAVQPLARKLATRLAQRRKRGRRGRLDVRRTIRRSLAHGGALIEPKFKPPRISKPEVVLLCDVSGSMATFARFTMQLTFAIGNSFSRVRSFAFIDGLDEVTAYFGPGTDFHDALLRMGAEADLVWRDGHSDYGNALTVFRDEYLDAVTPRSTVIITGDARNNYRPTATNVLAEIASRARALFWLNPEGRRYWNTGDSVMASYAEVCDGVYEVQTLRQLESFVESVVLPSPARAWVPPVAAMSV
jgi:uncharacterized protein with von Willebrand factor type A (vWA) domain